MPSQHTLEPRYIYKDLLRVVTQVSISVNFCEIIMSSILEHAKSKSIMQDHVRSKYLT